MSEGSLSLSIDLEAEIVNITGRQHLNAVHYAVQLVRHALRHEPRRIDITSTRRTFVLEHDGRPFDEAELELLWTILGRDDHPRRQAALSALEAAHGIALLSLLRTAAAVDIDSARSLRARAGVLEPAPPWPRPGTRVVVHRPRKSRRAELHELSFYCRKCAVPITVNGRRLEGRPADEPDPSRSILESRFSAPGGAGVLGMARSGALSRTRFYKQGIYFGVRQTVPSDRVPLEGTWDSRDTGFEENFHRSVAAGQQALRVARAQLLDNLPGRLGLLDEAERLRVRRLLLGMSRRRWSPTLRALKLFDCAARQSALSVDDLEATGKRRGFIAYLPRHERESARLPGLGLRGPRAYLPLLDAEEVASLARVARFPLRRALHAPVSEEVDVGWRVPDCPDARPLEERALGDVAPPLRGLLEALRDAPGGRVRFALREAGPRVLIEGPPPAVALSLNDPLLRSCATRFEADPGTLELIRAALAGP